MRLTRRLAVLAAVALASLGLASCSGSGITIGIKFDQPGMGLKAGDNYTGFDVDVARYVAKELGYSEDQITFKEAPTPQRETLITNGQVKMVVGTYSMTDERRAKVGFAGAYLVAGQDLLVRSDETSITGPDTLGGKRLCSVANSTSAKNVQAKYAKSVQLVENSGYSQCVEALLGNAVDAVTTDNTILAGYAAQESYKGKLKVVGKPFSTENYGIGLKKGDTEFCTKVKDALTKLISSGEWQTLVDKNIGPSGLKLDPATNPPKNVTCS
jgi:glutamate transport system substrate-binding protein